VSYIKCVEVKMKKKPANLVLSVDVVALTAPAGRLQVLLIRRDKAPFAGERALPGVAVASDETLAVAAARALAEKAGVDADAVRDLHVEQLATFDAIHRDPRGRTVSAAYLALARAALDVGQGAEWVDVDDVPAGSLPFDHDQILETAVERLRGRLRYSDIAAHLVEPSFPLDELHACYEGVLGRELDRSNFRAKLLKVGLIEKVGVDRSVGRRGGRPRHLYRFVRGRTVRDFL
jgi:8-oxo-dGTP diphosphatase